MTDEHAKIATEAAQIERIDRAIHARDAQFFEPLDTDTVSRWLIAAIITIGVGIIVGAFIYAALANWTATVDQAAMMGGW